MLIDTDRQQSHRTTGTFRSTRTNFTAGTTLTTGTEGSLRPTTYQVPSPLSETKNARVPERRSDEMPMDADLNSAMALMDEASSPTKAQGSSKGRQKTKDKKQPGDTQRKAPPTRMFGFFRRKSDSRQTTTAKIPVSKQVLHEVAALTATIPQSQAFEEFSNRDNGILVSALTSTIPPRQDYKVFTNRDKGDHHVSASNSHQGKLCSAQTPAARELSRDDDEHIIAGVLPQQRPDKNVAAKDIDHWVGSILVVPKITLEYQSEALTTARSTNISSKRTMTRSSAKMDVYKQAPCQALVEPCKWPVRSFDNGHISSHEEDEDCEDRSLDAAEFLTISPSLEGATSTSSSIQFMLDQFKKADTRDSTETSSTRAYVRPPCLLANTSSSSVSSSSLFEFMTVSAMVAGSGALNAPPRLEVTTSSHSVHLLRGHGEKTKANHDIAGVPSHTLLQRTETSCSIQLTMKKFMDKRGRVDAAAAAPQRRLSLIDGDDTESPIDCNPSLQLITPTSSTQWTSLDDNDEANISQTVLQVTTSTSSCRTMEWKSFNTYFGYATPPSPRYTTPPRLRVTNSVSSLHSDDFSERKPSAMVSLEPAAAAARNETPSRAIPQSCSGSSLPCCTIEIAPGITVPMRGAEETMLYVAAAAVTTCNAEQTSLIATCACWTCSTTIHCVTDAAYILCPVCRTVQPTDSKNIAATTAWGVGLGFLTTDWNAWNVALAQ